MTREEKEAVWLAAVSMATPSDGPPGLKGDASSSTVAGPFPVMVKVPLDEAIPVSVSLMERETDRVSVHPRAMGIAPAPQVMETGAAGPQTYADQ